MRLDIVDMESLALAMDWIFMIVPYYNLAHALFHISKSNAILNVSKLFYYLSTFTEVILSLSLSL